MYWSGLTNNVVHNFSVTGMIISDWCASSPLGIVILALYWRIHSAFDWSVTVLQSASSASEHFDRVVFLFASQTEVNGIFISKEKYTRTSLSSIRSQSLYGFHWCSATDHSITALLIIVIFWFLFRKKSGKLAVDVRFVSFEDVSQSLHNGYRVVSRIAWYYW